jgi:hypothetical protein
VITRFEAYDPRGFLRKNKQNPPRGSNGPDSDSLHVLRFWYHRLWFLTSVPGRRYCGYQAVRISRRRTKLFSVFELLNSRTVTAEKNDSNYAKSRHRTVTWGLQNVTFICVLLYLLTTQILVMWWHSGAPCGIPSYSVMNLPTKEDEARQNNI